MFGVYDTADECWLGDDHGPKLFADEMLARVSAQLTCAQMGWTPTRCVARPYQGGLGWTLKDELPTLLAPAEAMAALTDRPYRDKDSMAKIRLKSAPKNYKRGPGLTGKDRLQRRVDGLITAAYRLHKKEGLSPSGQWAEALVEVLRKFNFAQETVRVIRERHTN